VSADRTVGASGVLGSQEPLRSGTLGTDLCLPARWLFIKGSDLKYFYSRGVHCDISIYTCDPSLGHPCHYSLSSPLFLLKVISTGFHVPCSRLHRKYLSHLRPPLPAFFTLHLPPVTFH
jgi:hypothetical protein